MLSLLFTCLNQCFSACETGILVIICCGNTKDYAVLAHCNAVRHYALFANSYNAVVVDVRSRIVFGFFAYTQLYIISDNSLFCYNRLIQFTVLLDDRYWGGSISLLV